MVQITSFVCAALLCVSTVLALPTRQYARGFDDIAEVLEARGLDFTARDIGAFVNYLETRVLHDYSDPIKRPSAPVAGHSTNPRPASSHHSEEFHIPEGTKTYDASKKNHGKAVVNKIKEVATKLKVGNAFKGKGKKAGEPADPIIIHSHRRT